MKGGCLCGAIRYTIDASTVSEIVCHCKNCQRQTGTAFSVLVAVPERSIQISGELRMYLDAGESGTRVERYFCPICGSPIYTSTPIHLGVFIVKAGTLDDISAMAPRMHIWCDSAWPWTTFPEKSKKYARGMS